MLLGFRMYVVNKRLEKRETREHLTTSKEDKVNF